MDMTSRECIFGTFEVLASFGNVELMVFMWGFGGMGLFLYVTSARKTCS